MDFPSQGRNSVAFITLTNVGLVGHMTKTWMSLTIWNLKFIWKIFTYSVPGCYKTMFTLQMPAGLSYTDKRWWLCKSYVTHKCTV
jgi:hypothetical protein